jgi:hypothetical protein
MRNRAKKICVFILIGVIYMVNIYGCTGSSEYARYSSKDQELNLTADYIRGWLSREHRGPNNSYASVLFYEDKKDKGFKAHISITAKSSSTAEVSPSTLDAYTDDLIAKRLKFKDAKVLSKSKIRLLGTLASSIELSYKALDKLYTVDAKLIPVKERVVILKKADKFYVLLYQNKEEEFKKFSKAFSHIIKTLKLKDGK